MHYITTKMCLIELRNQDKKQQLSSLLGNYFLSFFGAHKYNVFFRQRSALLPYLTIAL